MVRDELTLRSATSTAATAVAAVGVLLLTLALAAELFRRRNPNACVVVLADRLLPSTARRVAVALLTVVSTLVSFVGPTDASADTSIREWLSHQPPTTTTTTATTTTAAPSDRPTRSDAGSGAGTDAGTDGAIASPQTLSGGGHGSVRTWLSEPGTPSPSFAAAPPATPTQPSPPPGSSRRARPSRPPGPSPSTTTSTPRRSRTAAPPPPVPLRSVAATELAPPATVTFGSAYVVAPGDCLWSLSARILGPRTTNAAIDRAWRAIYAANVVAIGPDPNLIHPGMELLVPRLDPAP